jgi:predicted SnoaL-like aldol condensation-catalyzing enzyme
MKTTEENNKKLVLEAFDTLFNKRDYAAAERYWSPHYIQHSNHIEPGREGLFNLIKSLPPTLKYEPGLILAGGDFVIVHGRFSGFGGPVNWIAADIVRVQDGILVEHWDVIQDEATQEQSKSACPCSATNFRNELSELRRPSSVKRCDQHLGDISEHDNRCQAATAPRGWSSSSRILHCSFMTDAVLVEFVAAHCDRVVEV